MLHARRREIGVVAGLLAFVAATNRWIGFQAGFRLLQAHDETDFHAIAVAAPHLPTAKLQEQHAQRFPFHYVIGLIASGLGLNVDTVYRIAMLLTAVALCGLLAAIVTRIGVTLPIFATCMAAFVLNTYSLRYYGLAPAEIADLLFALGVLISILGVIEQRLELILAGVAWGTLARQSEVPVAIALAAWVAFAPGWRDAAPLVRALRAVATLALTGAIYGAEVAIAAPFSAHTTPGFAHFTILSDLEHLSSRTGLGQHFVRSFNGLLGVGALLLVALAVLVRGRDGVGNAARALPAGFWGCALVAGAVILQPIVFSPEYAAHNETRLAVLGLGALVCMLAFALRELDRRLPGTLTARTAAVVTAILAVGSFHHLYTVIRTGSANASVALQLVTALCAAAVLAVAVRRAARAT